jgi:hypothetical protein
MEISNKPSRPSRSEHEQEGGERTRVWLKPVLTKLPINETLGGAKAGKFTDATMKQS